MKIHSEFAVDFFVLDVFEDVFATPDDLVKRFFVPATVPRVSDLMNRWGEFEDRHIDVFGVRNSP